MGDFFQRKCYGRLVFFIFVLVIFFNIFGCTNQEDENMEKANKVDESHKKVSDLTNKKFFFGHHSVGSNILDGVEQIVQSTKQFKLNIIETVDPEQYSQKTILGHGKVGKNYDPYSKIKDFEKIMNDGVGESVDIAFMKFCFVDIGTKTDLDEVFKQYKATMTSLKKKYPNTTFVHFTVPLLSEPTGFAKMKRGVKMIIKHVMGDNYLYENSSKNEYNKLVRDEYYGKETLFDLAAIEATYPDGKKSTFSKNGIKYESLVPEYTNDGGHLNTSGRIHVAKNLLEFLKKLD